MKVGISSLAKQTLLLRLAYRIIWVTLEALGIWVLTIEFVVPARALCVRISSRLAVLQATLKAAITFVVSTLGLVVLGVASHVAQPRLDAPRGI